MSRFRSINNNQHMGLNCGSSIHNLANTLVVIIVLMGQTNWAEGQAATESESETDYSISPSNVVNNEVFHIVVIGDSIAWGAGLNRDEKYSHLVAKWLAEQLDRPVNVKVLAHTGATLVLPDDKRKEDIYCEPDCISSTPTIEEQIGLIRSANDVDLVLMSGGINDVNVDDIINAGLSESKIISRTQEMKKPLYNTIIQLLDKCKRAKVIVTGYYPIISDGSSQSKLTILDMYLHPIDHALLLPTVIKQNLVRNSYAFYGESITSISNAVRDANIYAGNDRTAYVNINFESKNCFSASESWLWDVELELALDTIGKTNDNKYDYRSSHCDQCQGSYKGTDANNALGHPNIEGAKQYAKAIEAVIQGKGLNWLDSVPPQVQAFNVEPLRVTSGEPITIYYRISDSDGSGLKQVELWRKDEQSDWQKIETYGIDGGDDPLADSFTHSPSVPGKYWYGIHVVDNANNWNDQWNSNTNGKPLPFEPVEVDVIGTQEANPEEDLAEVELTDSDIDNWFKEQLPTSDFHKIYGHTAMDDGIMAGIGAPIEQKQASELVQSATYIIGDGKYEEALAELDKAIQLDPNNWGIWTNKMVALCALGRYSEALECKPSDLEKSLILYNLGRYDEALLACEKAIEQENANDDSRNDGYSWYVKAGILLRMGRTADSDVAFAKAKESGYTCQSFRKGYGDNCILLTKGRNLYNQRKYDEAIEVFEMIIESDSQDYFAWYMKGNALFSQGKYDEAIIAFDKSIEVRPQYNAAGWHMKGSALLSQGKYDEAIIALDKSLEISPQYNAAAWHDKGSALKALGRTAEADAAFAKANEQGYND